MHLLLKKVDSSSLTIIKELDDREFGSIINALAELEKYEEFYLSFRICSQNAKDLTEIVSKLTRFQSPNLGTAEQRFIKFKISQLISNFISSYYNFLSFCESNANNWFGAQAKIEVKKIISSMYDKFYLYKFLYKFRNYITHQGLPLHFAFLSDGKFKILLSIEKLLLDYSEWGADLRSELKANSESKLNLLELFSNSDHTLNLLAKQLNDYFIGKVDSSRELVKGFLQEAIDISSEYKIYSSSKHIDIWEVGNREDLIIYPIPLESFRSS